MIGYNSIVQNFLIKVKGSKKPVEVLVQANKNYGICDFLFPKSLEESEKLKSNLLTEKLRSDLLSKVQGRQINDEDVCIHVYNLLEEALNS